MLLSNRTVGPYFVGSVREPSTSGNGLNQTRSDLLMKQDSTDAAQVPETRFSSDQNRSAGESGFDRCSSKYFVHSAHDVVSMPAIERCTWQILSILVVVSASRLL